MQGWEEDGAKVARRVRWPLCLARGGRAVRHCDDHLLRAAIPAALADRGTSTPVATRLRSATCWASQA